MEVTIKPNDIYSISLTIKDTTFQIEKKFTDFQQLSQGLKVSKPNITLPAFPSNPKDVTSNIIQEYLQALINSGIIEADIFLEISSHVPRAKRPTILIPLPDNDFDPSEVGVPWKLMTQSGFEIVFATEEGKQPKADELLTRDEGVLLGQLGADPQPKQFYFEMEQSPNFQNPIKWADIVPTDYDGILLGGGHAPRMRQYLESTVLQEKVSQFWQLNRPFAAICHGVLLAARSKIDGNSILKGRKTTSLPAYMEKLAYGLTFWKLGRYYRTYEEYCETDIESHLENKSDFISGPTTLGARGSLFDDRNTFVLEDKNYISSRWPGDAYAFGKQFITKVNQYLLDNNAL